MYEAMQKFLSVPDNVRGLATTALSAVVVLATTAMIAACPHVFNYCLGVAVMISTLVLAKVK